MRAGAQNGGVDAIVHIHLVNRLASAAAIIARLRGRLPPDRLRISEETVDLAALSDAERPYLLRVPALPRAAGAHCGLRAADLCADVDQLIMASVQRLLAEMNGYDVGLLHDPLNALNLMSYFSATAAFFAPTAAALAFADKVRRYIDYFLTAERSPLWHLDQAALAATYLNDPAAVRLRRFPFSIVHSRPAGDDQVGDAVFWSITYRSGRTPKSSSPRGFANMHDKIDGLETRDAAQAVRPRIAVVSTTIPPGASRAGPRAWSPAGISARGELPAAGGPVAVSGRRGSRRHGGKLCNPQIAARLFDRGRLAAAAHAAPQCARRHAWLHFPSRPARSIAMSDPSARRRSSCARQARSIFPPARSSPCGAAFGW